MLCLLLNDWSFTCGLLRSTIAECRARRRSLRFFKVRIRLGRGPPVLGRRTVSLAPRFRFFTSVWIAFNWWATSAEVILCFGSKRRQPSITSKRRECGTSCNWTFCGRSCPRATCCIIVLESMSTGYARLKLKSCVRITPNAQTSTGKLVRAGGGR